MSSILLPKRFYSQPHGPVEVWHPNCVGALIPGLLDSYQTIGGVKDYSPRRLPNIEIEGTAPAGRHFIFSDRGRVVQLHPSGGTSGVGCITIPRYDTNGELTVLWGGYLDNIFSNAQIFAMGRDGSGSGWGARLSYNASSELIGKYVDNPTTAEYGPTMTGLSLAVGRYEAAAFKKTGTTVTVFDLRSGRSQSAGGGNGGFRTSTKGYGLAATTTSASGGHQRTNFFFVFNAALADTEIWSYLHNPWQLFKPIKQVLYFDSAISGGTAITATPATVTVAGQAATLRQTTLVPASVATVAVTGQTATILQPTVIACTAATVTSAGQTATIRQTTLVPATAATVTVAGQSATVQEVTVGPITASPATVVVSGQQATLRQTTQVPATAATVVVEGQAATLRLPTVVAASPATVVVEGQAATITGEVPTVIACTAATVVVTCPSATIASGILHSRTVRRGRTKIRYDEETGHAVVDKAPKATAKGRLATELPEPPAPAPAQPTAKVVQLRPVRIEAKAAEISLADRVASLQGQVKRLRADLSQVARTVDEMAEAMSMILDRLREDKDDEDLAEEEEAVLLLLRSRG